MKQFTKILNSSTAWLGAIVAGVTQLYPAALPPWLAAVIVGAYGVKEVGTKIVEAANTKYVDNAEQRDHEAAMLKAERTVRRPAVVE